MRVVLREFQEDAVRRLARQLRRAGEEIDDGVPQAVVLSSPTGSGKTVIATAVIEYLLNGDPDGEVGPNPDATFVWVTDQPDLNEQTRRKMIEHSTVLNRSHLIDIVAPFSEETFECGRVYFINTQRLRKGGLLTRRTEKRPWTFWDTVRNTVASRRRSFIVVIDEAHRGMTLSLKERNEAKSIIQRFIRGSEEAPAVPIILGISATTERFHALLAVSRSDPQAAHRGDTRLECRVRSGSDGASSEARTRAGRRPGRGVSAPLSPRCREG